MSVDINKDKFREALESQLATKYGVPYSRLDGVLTAGGAAQAIWYDDPYLVLYLNAARTHPSVIGWHTIKRWTHPTTVECKGMINAANANCNQWVLGLECAYGGLDEAGNQGWAFFSNGAGGTYWAKSNDGVGTEQTNLGAQDWTVERTFKIEWTATYVDFYVDDGLVAHHTTRIPNVPMEIYLELSTTNNLVADAAVYRRFDSLRII